MRLIGLLRNLSIVLIGFAIINSLSSCGSTQNLIYMQGKFDTAKLSTINPVDPVIRKGDILSIIVYSDNPDATKIFNQLLITTSNPSISAGTSQGIGGTAPSAPGYQVDIDGNIVFQGIGKLHVEGLTKSSLKDTLDVRLKPFLQNPYYSIKFLNYNFTMLGEFGSPGIKSIPGERINLLQAIALAGDITFYGDRHTVLIIRENNNKREFGRLDLTKPDIMNSPYFYVQQNDIIYVEPTRNKAAANDVVTVRNIGLALTIVTTFAVLYTIFR